MEFPIDEFDHWLVHLIANKSPKESIAAWELFLGDKIQVPTFRDFEEFLNKGIVAVNAIERRNTVMPGAIDAMKSTEPPKAKNTSSFAKSNNRNNSNERKVFHTTTQKPKSSQCVLCSNTHHVRQCQLFLAKVCLKQKKIVDQHKLCLNCLSNTHFLS